MNFIRPPFRTILEELDDGLGQVRAAIVLEEVGGLFKKNRAFGMG